MGRMKCPHCGNQHAPGTLFCPETGKPIAQLGATIPEAMTPPGVVEPKGVAAHLAAAFELYRKHFVPLVLTAGIVLVPIGLIAGLLSSAMTTDAAVTGMQARGDRMQQHNRELRELQRKVQSGDADEQRAAAERIADLQRETVADARAMTAAAGGMLARLGAYVLLALLLIPLRIIAGYLAQAALIPMIGDRALGGNMSVGQAWAAVSRRVVPLVITSILAGLAVGIGLLLCVLPGIVLAFLFAFGAPVVMLEGKSAVDALKRSSQLVRNHWVDVLLVFIAYLVVVGIPSLIVGWILTAIAGSLGASLIVPFLSAALFPLPTLMLVMLYLDLRRTDEGISEAELHQRMAGQLA